MSDAEWTEEGERDEAKMLAAELRAFLSVARRLPERLRRDVRDVAECLADFAPEARDE